MVGREDGTNNTKHKDVLCYATVTLPQSDCEQRDLGIHKNTLEPAVLTGGPTGNFGKEEATGSCNGGHNQHAHNRMARKERPQCVSVRNTLQKYKSNEDVSQKSKNREKIDYGEYEVFHVKKILSPTIHRAPQPIFGI